MCRQCMGFEALDEDCKGYACPLYVHRHGGCNDASRVIDWASYPKGQWRVASEEAAAGRALPKRNEVSELVRARARAMGIDRARALKKPSTKA